MTAVAPQAAASWSSVAKTSVRGVTRLAVFGFAPLPYPPPRAGEGKGGCGGSLAGVRLDGRGAVPETEGEG